MRKYLILTVAAAVLSAGGVTAQAQPYPGMMGGYNDNQAYGPGPGWMMGPGMMGGYGPGWMMGNGYGPGPGPGWMMMRGNYGPQMMGPNYYANQGNLNLSVTDVTTYLQRMVQNPNLKVGEVKEKDADTIIAEIVTKDKDALVQRFVVNRHSGFFQPEQ